jgi:2,3-dihydro-2,3-dihydroxybenzoate dehydrogenase
MIAVVTGGAEGIGAAIARLLVKEGYTVYVLDIAEKSNQPGLFFKKCDIAKDHEVLSCLSSIPNIDLLINNAAYQSIGNLYSFSHEEWRRTIDVNVNGTFYVTQAAIEKMNPGAQIIILGSIHGSVPRLGKFAYDASKAALEMMTKEFAGALADRRIRVNMVEIGATFTDMNASFNTDAQEKESAQEKVPLSVIFQPDDVAQAVCALTHNEFRFMTGSVVVYDGGRSLGIYPIEHVKENDSLPSFSDAPKEYLYDVFIAYHGSFDNGGSYRKAQQLKNVLEGDYGFKCFLYEVGKDYCFKDTPFISAVSRAVVFVVNENVRLSGDGSLLSEDIKNELKAYRGDDYVFFCTGTMRSEEVNYLDSRGFKRVSFAECEFPSFHDAVEALAKRLQNSKNPN